jgi:hypothetical protein
VARTGTEDRVGVGWGCSLRLAFILWSALYFLQGFRRVSTVVGEVLILKLGSVVRIVLEWHRLVAQCAHRGRYIFPTCGCVWLTVSGAQGAQNGDVFCSPIADHV